MLKSINPFDQSIVDEFEEIAPSLVQDKLIRPPLLSKIGRRPSFAYEVN